MTRDTLSVGPGWWGSLSSGTRQRIEEATAAEAGSCVVRPARVEQTNVSFWRYVDARRSASPSGRLRLCAPARPAARE